MKVVANKTIYEFTPEDIKRLIAASLKIPINKISIDYVIEEIGADYMDRYRGTDTVTKINVTVNSKED